MIFQFEFDCQPEVYEMRLAYTNKIFKGRLSLKIWSAILVFQTEKKRIVRLD